MPVRSFQTNGIYQDVSLLRLESGKRVDWQVLSALDPPRIPFGTPIKLVVTYEERDFLNGVDGVVWATYDHFQAETIQGALQAQNISSEARELLLNEWLLHLLFIPDADEVQEAIDFIWRHTSGMRLKPDWWYPAGIPNKSFRKWIDGG